MGDFQCRPREYVTKYYFNQSRITVLFAIFYYCVDYYRVLYDVTNYALIRDQLIIDHNKISANNRGQMLDDTFNLALANLVPYTQAMDLTLYLKNEREYVPWYAVLSELNYIDTMLYNLPEFTNWKVHLLIFN